MNYDRFCGGYLNVESDEEESIPLYSEVSSQIIWLQVISHKKENLIENVFFRDIKTRVVDFTEFLMTIAYFLVGYWYENTKGIRRIGQKYLSRQKWRIF